ncbi:hypothetical protein POM88_037000 [Heracleum sosnowskyi]|uniref:Uncharacterized protein n=1 Tax=Heracleum sosnowskyi TaxID=360622 RepID=A0AAD8MG91_9APIA|nr:hypothetical protein POM88_037000 [Heracleum sosnowskyi]
METPSRKRGRPRIVVTEAVAEVSRLAVQQRNARRTTGLRTTSPGASLSDAGCVPSLAGKHKGGAIMKFFPLTLQMCDASEDEQKKGATYFALCSDSGSVNGSSGITAHDIGRPDQVCGYCTAQVWAAELTGRHIGSGPKGYSICCGKGKVHLPLLREAPPELMALLTGNGGRERKFQQNNCIYNTIFALCSFGGTVDEAINNGSGPYVFRVNLQTYHSIGSLVPPDGRTPKFAQFYMYDGQEAVDYRLGFPRHRNVLDAEVVGILQEMLVRVNALVQIFRQVRERYPLS